MKIGYPCINRSIGCTANSTFRLRNYAQDRMIETIENNLNCLQKILAFNVAHGLKFFRISSDLVPFASHPICTFDWRAHFSEQFTAVGNYIKQHDLRISMHPDQFVVLNSPNENTVANSIAELMYQCLLLDAMQLDKTAKMQIHVGGAYGDKAVALKRFINTYQTLSDIIKKRLVIENDDRLFTLADCMRIHEGVGIPIIFDNLHHDCNNEGETMVDALQRALTTWKKADGILMADYSSQAPGERVGKHIESIDEIHFTNYIQLTNAFDFDIMLEIKDKEPSALKAIEIVKRQKL